MIYLGADHRGFLLKEKVKEYLQSLSLDTYDLGPASIDPDDDYPAISIKLAELVAQKHLDLGILVCGSGAGACIASNKVIGARSTIGFSPKQIAAARSDDNINILCLSANHIDDDTNLEIVKKFIDTHFDIEERYLRRLKEVSDYESQTR